MGWLGLAVVVQLLLATSPVPAFAADSGGSGCGSGSGSGSGCDTSTPPPTSHLETILQWDCDGKIVLFPDNPVFAVYASIPMIPRMFQTALDVVRAQLESHCRNAGGSPSDFAEEFLRRYHPINALLYGNRLYKGQVLSKVDCLDNVDYLTRDLLKLYDSITGKTSFEMPSSCVYYKWDNKDADQKVAEKMCKFKHELMQLGATLQFVAKSCPANTDFFKLSISCEGGGCQVLTPCYEDAHCGDKDKLACTNIFNWIDEKQPTKGPKFTEADMYNILRDKLFVYEEQRNLTTETCVNKPHVIVSNFMHHFAADFVNSQDEQGNQITCSSASGHPECKVCLPRDNKAFEKSVTSIPDRYETLKAKSRIKLATKDGKDGCGLTASALLSNSSPLATSEKYPGILSPTNPQGVHAKFFPDSPLCRGTKITLEQQDDYVGGGACAGDNQCGHRGLCLTVDDFCLIGDKRCGEVADQCKLNASNHCVAKAPSTEKKCACFAVEQDASGSSLVHGKNCETTSRLGGPDAVGPLSPFYTEEAGAKRARFNPLIYWDGYVGPGKVDPFKWRDHWAKWPKLTAPKGEHHVFSVQCDGMIHAFLGKPYAIRVYKPRLDELLHFAMNASLDVWKCRDITQVSPQRFLVAQGFHRPEPYLYAKIREAAGTTSTLHPPSGFEKSFAHSLFPATGVPSDIFSWASGDHLLQFSDGFSLHRWLTKNYIGTKWTGIKEVFSSGFSLNIRASTCRKQDDQGQPWMGLVRYDVTCSGVDCAKYLNLATPCSTSATCPSPLKCRDVFSSIWEGDYFRKLLWGDVPSPTNANMKTMCPIISPVKDTSKADAKALYKSVALIWRNILYPRCDMRTQEQCWRDCKWSGNAAECLPVEDVPNVGPYEVAKIKFCTPHIFPVSEAFTTDLGKTTGQEGKPDSSNVYKVARDTYHGMPAAFFQLNGCEDLEKPTEYTQDYIDKPADEDDGSATFGTSFIVVMISMATIVLISTLVVWYNYIRQTPEEKSRQSRLKELNFNWKSEEVFYGRDLMYPDMCKEWLPGGEDAAAAIIAEKEKALGRQVEMDEKEKLNDAESTTRDAESERASPAPTQSKAGSPETASTKPFPVISQPPPSRNSSKPPKSDPEDLKREASRMSRKSRHSTRAPSEVSAADSVAMRDSRGSSNPPVVSPVSPTPAGSPRSHHRRQHSSAPYVTVSSSRPTPTPTAPPPSADRVTYNATGGGELQIDTVLPPGPPPSGTRPSGYLRTPTHQGPEW